MGNQELYDYGRGVLGLDSKEFGKRYGESASELSYNKLKEDIVKKVGTVEEPFIDTPTTPGYKAANVPLVHKQNIVEPIQLLKMGPKELGEHFGISAKRAKGIKAAMEAVDKSFEGQMLMFPAPLQHIVYPFYTSDESRITVSGNIKLWVDDK